MKPIFATPTPISIWSKRWLRGAAVALAAVGLLMSTFTAPPSFAEAEELPKPGLEKDAQHCAPPYGGTLRLRDDLEILVDAGLTTMIANPDVVPGTTFDNTFMDRYSASDTHVTDVVYADLEGTGRPTPIRTVSIPRINQTYIGKIEPGRAPSWVTPTRPGFKSALAVGNLIPEEHYQADEVVFVSAEQRREAGKDMTYLNLMVIADGGSATSPQVSREIEEVAFWGHSAGRHLEAIDVLEVVTGDFDGDAHDEIAFAYVDEYDRVAINIYDVDPGNGALTRFGGQQKFLNITTAGQVRLAVGDLDRDYVDELVVQTADPDTHTAVGIHVLDLGEDGFLRPLASGTVDWGNNMRDKRFAVAVADADGDQFDDEMFLADETGQVTITEIEAYDTLDDNDMPTVKFRLLTVAGGTTEALGGDEISQFGIASGDVDRDGTDELVLGWSGVYSGATSWVRARVVQMNPLTDGEFGSINWERAYGAIDVVDPVNRAETFMNVALADLDGDSITAAFGSYDSSLVSCYDDYNADVTASMTPVPQWRHFEGDDPIATIGKGVGDATTNSTALTTSTDTTYSWSASVSTGLSVGEFGGSVSIERNGRKSDSSSDTTTTTDSNSVTKSHTLQSVHNRGGTGGVSIPKRCYVYSTYEGLAPTYSGQATFNDAEVEVGNARRASIPRNDWVPRPGSTSFHEDDFGERAGVITQCVPLGTSTLESPEWETWEAHNSPYSKFTQSTPNDHFTLIRPDWSSIALFAEDRARLSSGSTAGNAVDGQLDSSKSAHTTGDETNPWWQIDLGYVRDVAGIRVLPADDKLANVVVFISEHDPSTLSDDPHELEDQDGVWAYWFAGPIVDQVAWGTYIADQFSGSGNAAAKVRYIRVQRFDDNRPLNLSEVQVFAPDTLSPMDYPVSVRDMNPDDGMYEVEMYNQYSDAGFPYTTVDVRGELLVDGTALDPKTGKTRDTMPKISSGFLKETFSWSNSITHSIAKTHSFGKSSTRGLGLGLDVKEGYKIPIVDVGWSATESLNRNSETTNGTNEDDTGGTSVTQDLYFTVGMPGWESHPTTESGIAEYPGSCEYSFAPVFSGRSEGSNSGFEHKFMSLDYVVPAVKDGMMDRESSHLNACRLGNYRLEVTNEPPVLGSFEEQPTPIDTPIDLNLLMGSTDANHHHKPAIASVELSAGDPGSVEVLNPGQLGERTDTTFSLTRYTPPPGFTGLVELIVKLTDGEEFSAPGTVKIRVGRGVEDSIDAAIGVSTKFDVLHNDRLSTDTEELKVVAVEGGNHTDVALIDGEVFVTPLGNGNGSSDSFTYTARHGSEQWTASATVTGFWDAFGKIEVEGATVLDRTPCATSLDDYCPYVLPWQTASGAGVNGLRKDGSDIGAVLWVKDGGGSSIVTERVDFGDVSGPLSLTGSFSGTTELTTIRVLIDGDEVGSADISTSGLGQQPFAIGPVDVPSGMHDVTLVLGAVGEIGMFSLDYITFEQVEPTATLRAASSRIEAESFDAAGGGSATIQGSGASAYVNNLTEEGQWLEYKNVDFGDAGQNLWLEGLRHSSSKWGHVDVYIDGVLAQEVLMDGVPRFKFDLGAAVTGTHDVRLVLRRDHQENGLALDYITFVARESDQSQGIRDRDAFGRIEAETAVITIPSVADAVSPLAVTRTGSSGASTNGLGVGAYLGSIKTKGTEMVFEDIDFGDAGGELQFTGLREVTSKWGYVTVFIGDDEVGSFKLDQSGPTFALDLATEKDFTGLHDVKLIAYQEHGGAGLELDYFHFTTK